MTGGSGPNPPKLTAPNANPIPAAMSDIAPDASPETAAAYHDRDGWIWFDGELVPWREANIHVLTHALHYASSVFEGQRAYSGEIFRLSDHSERLIRSGKLLGFDIPWTREEIDEACRQVLAAS